MRWLIAIVMVLSAQAHRVVAQEALVQIYIVQHPEMDAAAKDPAALPLSAAGHQRAALLAPTFANIRLTHLIGTHTLRSRQTLEPVARGQSLAILQLPRPGSTLDGQLVDDRLTRQAAVGPVAEALLALPAGSVALIAGNSDNIFAILNRLGVPLKPGCAAGDRCVPCLDNTCWRGGAPDRLWHLAVPAGKAEPVVFAELRGLGGVAAEVASRPCRP